MRDSGICVVDFKKDSLRMYTSIAANFFEGLHYAFIEASSLVSRGRLQRCALHSSARQVAFFWDIYAQSYVMIGNCCFWLVAITLLRPFNNECASSLAKFMCYFRNGIGLFSFVLAVKFQRDADNGMQDDDFISSCNIGLLVLMSFCLLLDLWPLTEVADGVLHYMEKRRNKHRSKIGEQKETKQHPSEIATPTPPSGPCSRPTSGYTLSVEMEADEREPVPCCSFRVDLVDGDLGDPSPSRNSAELAVRRNLGPADPHRPLPSSGLDSPATAQSRPNRPVNRPALGSTPGRSPMPDPPAAPKSRANGGPSDMPAAAVASEASSLLPVPEAVVSDNTAPEAFTCEQSASFGLEEDLEAILKSTDEQGPQFVLI